MDTSIHGKFVRQMTEKLQPSLEGIKFVLCPSKNTQYIACSIRQPIKSVKFSGHLANSWFHVNPMTYQSCEFFINGKIIRFGKYTKIVIYLHKYTLKKSQYHKRNVRIGKCDEDSDHYVQVESAQGERFSSPVIRKCPEQYPSQHNSTEVNRRREIGQVCLVTNQVKLKIQKKDFLVVQLQQKIGSLVILIKGSLASKVDYFHCKILARYMRS